MRHQILSADSLRRQGSGNARVLYGRPSHYSMLLLKLYPPRKTPSTDTYIISHHNPPTILRKRSSPHSPFAYV